MNQANATKKLFHVIVVVGMGTSVGAVACSSSTDSGGSTSDASSDAKGGGSDSSTMADGSMTMDASPMDGTSQEASADACAGWAPCC